MFTLQLLFKQFNRFVYGIICFFLPCYRRFRNYSVVSYLYIHRRFLIKCAYDNQHQTIISCRAVVYRTDTNIYRLGV